MSPSPPVFIVRLPSAELAPIAPVTVIFPVPDSSVRSSPDPPVPSIVDANSITPAPAPVVIVVVLSPLSTTGAVENVIASVSVVKVTFPPVIAILPSALAS